MSEDASRAKQRDECLETADQASYARHALEDVESLFPAAARRFRLLPARLSAWHVRRRRVLNISAVA